MPENQVPVDPEFQEVPEPEPFHLIISHELFQAIKNNQGLMPSTGKVNKLTADEFEKFKSFFKTFLDLLNKHQESAFSVLSTIMSMWGYSRKYCGMCGKPIIGKPGHIENRMVCPRCNEAFNIAEELYRRDADSPEFSEPRRPRPEWTDRKKFDKFANDPAKRREQNSTPSPRENDTPRR